MCTDLFLELKEIRETQILNIPWRCTKMIYLHVVYPKLLTNHLACSVAYSLFGLWWHLLSLISVISALLCTCSAKPFPVLPNMDFLLVAIKVKSGCVVPPAPQTYTLERSIGSLILPDTEQERSHASGSIFIQVDVHYRPVLSPFLEQQTWYSRGHRWLAILY